MSQQSGKLPSKQLMDPLVPCPACRAPLTDLARAFETYFTSDSIECSTCKGQINFWKAVLDAIIGVPAAFGQTVALAGGKTTVFQTQLAPNEDKHLNLIDFDIPGEAEVAYLNLTSSGSVMPTVLHGNDPLRDIRRPQLNLYGRASSSESGDGLVSVMVVWFVKKDDDTVIRHIVEAARKYQDGDFDGVIVPANIAVEASLTPAIDLALQGFAGKDHLASFLEEGATYSHQLNVLMPIVAFLSKVPRLPDNIRGLLNRLRRLRNAIAHEGKCEPKQSRENAAEHLAAALFGVRYGEFLRNAVAKAKGESLLPSTPT